MTPELTVVLIIVSAGVLGGITNFFLIYTTESITNDIRSIFFKSVLMGLCASFTVPLFLKVLSSSILDVTHMDSNNYFILAGLCVIASFFSKRFLEDLYSRLNKVEKTANEAKAQANDVEQKTQEIDDIDKVLDKISAEVISKYDHTQEPDKIKEVAKAVLKSSYSYRTVHGIAEDAKISDEQVKTILELIKKAGYVESKKTIKGNSIWTSNFYQ
jgi:tRNA G26 N,N-dimethylase Trm1